MRTTRKAVYLISMMCGLSAIIHVFAMDNASGDELQQGLDHRYCINIESVCKNPQRPELCVLGFSGWDGASIIKFFDLENGKEKKIKRLKDLHTQCAAYAPCGKYLVIGYSNGNVERQDTHSGKSKVINVSACVKSLSWNKDGTRLAVGLGDSRLAILSGKSLQVKRVIQDVYPAICWHPQSSIPLVGVCGQISSFCAAFLMHKDAKHSTTRPYVIPWKQKRGQIQQMCCSNDAQALAILVKKITPDAKKLDTIKTSVLLFGPGSECIQHVVKETERPYKFKLAHAPQAQCFVLFSSEGLAQLLTHDARIVGSSETSAGDDFAIVEDTPQQVKIIVGAHKGHLEYVDVIRKDA